MPRSRGSAPARRSAPSAPSRPQAPPAPRAAPQQTRPSSTAAHPQQAQAPPQQQAGSAGPGLFGQMASTAAGVAVGSSIGHAIGGMFGGSSSEAAPAQQDNTAAQDPNAGYYTGQSNAYQAPKVCETDVSNFRRCMDENGSDMNICGYYLDQLRACQAAAKPY